MEDKSPRSGRESALSFMLVILLGGMFFFFLNFVSFGIFFYVLAAVVGITAIGFLHYVLWGYDLSEEVAEEMQRERLKQQQEMDEHL
jgi:Ca2+/Na+ antiporter